jgi:hypothetical protein
MRNFFGPLFRKALREFMFCTPLCSILTYSAKGLTVWGAGIVRLRFQITFVFLRGVVKLVVRRRVRQPRALTNPATHGHSLSRTRLSKLCTFSA